MEIETLKNKADNTSDQKKMPRQNKKHRKRSKEMETDSTNSIKHFFKHEDKKDTNASTPVGAKKRSPPSATKPQAKRLNSNASMMANQQKENDEEYLSVMESADDISTSDEEIDNPKPTGLSPELLLLKNILRSELSADLDQIIESKISPLQLSIENLVRNGTTSTPSSDLRKLENDNMQLKTHCENILKENEELKMKL